MLATAGRPLAGRGGQEQQLRDETNKLLVSANRHLSMHESKSALKYYTHILKSVSPGHPIALINRALAYLDLDYPELAAADGHKAKMAVQALRSDHSYGLCTSSLRSIMSYSKMCEQAVTTYAYWTSGVMSYAGGNHETVEYDPMRVEPASIVLGIAKYKKVEPKDKVRVLLWDIDNKATYRLALGLWKVGAGARKDALHILESRLGYLEERTNDMVAFKDLQNTILEEMEVEFYEQDILADYKKLPKGKGRSHFLMSCTRGENMTKQALIKRKLYPWNQLELGIGGKSIPESLVRAVANVSTNTQLQAIKSAPGKLAQLTLIASRDIYADEEVLVEKSPIYVNTAFMHSAGYVYCDTCATKLLSSSQYLPPNRDEKMFAAGDNREESESPTEANTSFKSSLTSNISDTGSEPIVHSQDVATKGQDRPSFSPPALSSPSSNRPDSKLPTPPSENGRREYARSKAPSPSPHSSPQYPQNCNVCETVYCSRRCRLIADSLHHRPLCVSEIENRLRWDMLSPNGRPMLMRKEPGLSESKGYIKPDEQCVRELLLIKVLAIAVHTGQHPLQIDFIKYLGGGEFARSLENDDVDVDAMSVVCNSETSTEAVINPMTGLRYDAKEEHEHALDMPWSYEANIKTPYTFLSKARKNPIRDADRFDGWVINTLMAKIERSMRIAKCEAQIPMFLPDVDDDKVSIKEWIVTVASVHPFLSFMGNEGKNGEQGNVVIEEKGGGVIKCVAVGKETTNGQYDKGNGVDEAESSSAAGIDFSFVHGNINASVIAAHGNEKGAHEANSSASEGMDISFDNDNAVGAWESVVNGNNAHEADDSLVDEMNISFGPGDNTTNITNGNGNTNTTGEVSVDDHLENEDNAQKAKSPSIKSLPSTIEMPSMSLPDEMDVSFSNGDSKPGHNPTNLNPSIQSRTPAIRKGERLILRVSNVSPSLKYSNSNSTEPPPVNVRNWLRMIEEPIKCGDGDGSIESQSFYNGVIGARPGAENGKGNALRF